MSTSQEKSMESNLIEAFETQNVIIKMQSEVINDLLSLLMQHEAVEAVDNLPCIQKINKAARLREYLQREP